MSQTKSKGSKMSHFQLLLVVVFSKKALINPPAQHQTADKATYKLGNIVEHIVARSCVFPKSKKGVNWIFVECLEKQLQMSANIPNLCRLCLVFSLFLCSQAAQTISAYLKNQLSGGLDIHPHYQ